MTQGSIPEYTEAVRERYLRASKKEKARRLDEFLSVTRYLPHRSHPHRVPAQSSTLPPNPLPGSTMIRPRVTWQGLRAGQCERTTEH